MQKEDPESITTISEPHNLDEYTYKSYDELSKELQEVYPSAARAFELIAQMYNRLTLVDGLTHKDAFAKMHNDHGHLRGFSPRNIRRYLPANNPNIPRRVRTSRPKNSPTETSVETSFSDTKHNDEKNINHKIGTQNISNHVVDDISSDRTNNLSTVDTILTTANNSDKADLKTTSKDLNELSLPSRELLRYVTSERKKGKSEVWLTIKTNASTGEIVYVKTGRNSELLGRNSFEVQYD